MRKISPEVLEILLAEPQVCARRKEGGCAGRMTLEHVLTYGSRQIDEPWAIIWLCERHHSIGKYQDEGLLNKEINTYHALNKASDDDLIKYSKAVPYLDLKKRLIKKYDSM